MCPGPSPIGQYFRSIHAPGCLGGMTPAVPCASEVTGDPDSRVTGDRTMPLGSPLLGSSWGDHAELFTTRAAGTNDGRAPPISSLKEMVPRSDAPKRGLTDFPWCLFFPDFFLYCVLILFSQTTFNLFSMGQRINKMQSLHVVC